MCVGMFLGVIPTTESIALTNHVAVWSGLMCCFTGLYKLWRTISSTMSIFIKDKPVSFGGIYRECHVTLYNYFGFIFIWCVSIMWIFRIWYNVFNTCSNQPTHKGMLIVLRCIGHVNSIFRFRIRICCTITVIDYFLADRNASIAKVINLVLFS